MAPKHPFVLEAERRSDELMRGHEAYTGGPKFFHHNGHKREAAYPWLSDVEIAGEVRMLMRTDIAHEMVVCAARDRILHLSEEVERLRAALRPFAECKTTSTGDRDARHWQCLVSADHLGIARDLLGMK